MVARQGINEVLGNTFDGREGGIVKWFCSRGSLFPETYHLLELTGPKELVLICVNGKVKAGLCDYSHDPCVEYT